MDKTAPALKEFMVDGAGRGPCRMAHVRRGEWGSPGGAGVLRRGHLPPAKRWGSCGWPASPLLTSHARAASASPLPCPAPAPCLQEASPDPGASSSWELLQPSGPGAPPPPWHLASATVTVSGLGARNPSPVRLRPLQGTTSISHSSENPVPRWPHKPGTPHFYGRPSGSSLFAAPRLSR